ncbi:MAG TPA: branched-chain amino acid aminotransferase [Rhizomicrobium sp.]
MTHQIATRNTSRTWTFFEGNWHEGNVAIMGPRTQGAWLASVVFDGARAFEGVTPDLDLHCKRVNDSARLFKLKPVISDEEWLALALEGVKKFDGKTALYIRPMYWADAGVGGGVMFEEDSTRWCLCIYEAPMPEPKGSSITLSTHRRPTVETAPVAAKAGCLYPNNGHALMEAAVRGFDNCLLRDMLGNIAELANANVMMVKDGVVFTPSPNGTFLSGITRARVIGLLRGDGVTVVEKPLAYEDFLDADEIFSTGNYNKVAPMIRIDQRDLQVGPITRRARKLYWDFAHR